jgi:error-prone DNA polymerase
VGDFEHLVIHSSIIRPAANDCIQEYIRLHGGAWDPIHPLLADVLDETFGIMVYQEDVSRAAKALAGFRCRGRRPAQNHVQKRPAAPAGRLPPAFLDGALQRGVTRNRPRRYGP